MDKSERIKDLVELLNKANKAYYQEANEIMTNFEYDKSVAKGAAQQPYAFP